MINWKTAATVFKRLFQLLSPLFEKMVAFCDMQVRVKWNYSWCFKCMHLCYTCIVLFHFSHKLLTFEGQTFNLAIRISDGNVASKMFITTLLRKRKKTTVNLAKYHSKLYHLSGIQDG